MKTKNIKKELTKRTFKNLDKIYDAAVDIVKSWKVTLLPVNTFEEIVKAAKLKTDTDIEAINEYNEKYNTVLDSLVTSLTKVTRDNKLKGIPMAVLKESLNNVKRIIKESSK